MTTPTPRTDAVYLEHRHWAGAAEATEAIEDLRDLARKLQRELAGARTAKLRWENEARRRLAELAAERARLDYMSTRGFEHRHHETGDHLGYEWTISSYSESEDVTLRDVIDAEMKEETK